MTAIRDLTDFMFATGSNRSDRLLLRRARLTQIRAYPGSIANLSMIPKRSSKLTCRFQAYLDNIKAKTGKTPDDFQKLAEKKGLLRPGAKTGEIVQWLKSDFGLGHGHAMAIAGILTRSGSPQPSAAEKLDQLFSGNKSHWKKPCESFLDGIRAFGSDVHTRANETYINLLRDSKKFGIVQPSAADRLDIGIKLKGVRAKGRLQASGTWNAMVTHRVKVHEPDQLDSELLSWLRHAYEGTGLMES